MIDELTVISTPESEAQLRIMNLEHAIREHERKMREMFRHSEEFRKAMIYFAEVPHGLRRSKKMTAIYEFGKMCYP